MFIKLERECVYLLMYEWLCICRRLRYHYFKSNILSNSNSLSQVELNLSQDKCFVMEMQNCIYELFPCCECRRSVAGAIQVLNWDPQCTFIRHHFLGNYGSTSSWTETRKAAGCRHKEALMAGHRMWPSRTGIHIFAYWHGQMTLLDNLVCLKHTIALNP